MTKNTQLAQQSSNPAAEAKSENRAQRTPITPAVDIVENALGITLYADLPGVSKTGLDIKVHDTNLYIQAEASLPAPTGLNVHHAEINEPYFARSFALSADLDTARIEAGLDNGVLRLVIPRREEAQPRRIEISG